MIKKVISIFLLSFFNLAYTFAQLSSPNESQNKWVDSVYQRLSLEEKIGQLFMVAAYSSGNEQHFQVIDQLIDKYHIGGLIFMQGGPVRQVNLINRYQSKSEVPLIIGMDMEWGAGMRLDSVPSFPKQMILGAINDDQLIYQMGQEVAFQMKQLGVHINFAPVVDINNNPDNPVIGMRSFGESKENVANKAIQYMKGIQDSGLIACAKHFPGHGDTNTDSHHSLPVIQHSKDRLDQLELYPFKELINNGVSGIMNAHLYFPALEEEEKVPSSLSKNVVNGVLKKELGFDGLIFTDALNMKAITNSDQFDSPELAAMIAGNDILLFSQNVPGAIKEIKKAIRKKIIPKAQLEASVKKVLYTKYRVGLNNFKPLVKDNLIVKLNRPQTKALIQTLTKEAITALKNAAKLLPLDVLDNRNFASLSIGNEDNFSFFLDEYALFSHYQKKKNDEELLLNQLSNYDVIVVKIDSKKNLNRETISFLGKLNNKVDVITCFFGEPYDIDLVSSFPTVICAYQNTDIAIQAMAEAVFGAIEVEGRLPVTVSDQFSQGTGISLPKIGRLSHAVPESVGMDSRILSKIDEIVFEAILDSATPGCQVLVARKGNIIFDKSYGYHTYEQSRPVGRETIYDVASITKVAASMQAFMFLEERGYVDLDKKISHYVTDLKGTNKEHMIIRDILTHQAGLWPYIPFWKETLKDSLIVDTYYSPYPEINYQYQIERGLYGSQVVQDSVWHWVKNSKIRKKKPRTPYDYKYSDMGYYLLQKLIEGIINQPMEEFLQQNFYDPMGLNTMSYLPLCRYPMSRIAPTENDNYFRNTLVYGQVHDQGAALFGGVAGHAGLFSNALDLAKLMLMHLQDGEYGGMRYFQPGTLTRFTSQQYESNRRGVGWDKPLQSAWYGPTSQYSSPSTFGHTGFTGTAVWADPEFDLIYVFLSNRIHPSAENRKLIKNNIRTRIQDVIYESIWSYVGCNDAD
ncbi:MAG: glycoside hydrolase family 3 N-terminal domain-containing protein [Bacteroidota bacterium]